MKEQGNLLELVNGCEAFHYELNDPDDDIRLLKAQELRELGFVAKADELEKELNKKIRLNRIQNYKYIAITPERIKAFLKRKAERYDAEHAPKITPALGGYPETTGISPSARLWAEQMRNDRQSLAFGMNQQLSLARMYAETANIVEQSLDSLMRARRWWQTDSAFSFSEKTCDFLNTEEGTIGQFRYTEENIKDYKGIPPENVLESLKEHKAREVFDYFTIASVNAIKDPLLLGRIEGVEERFFIDQWGDDVCLDDIL